MFLFKYPLELRTYYGNGGLKRDDKDFFNPLFWTA